MLLRAIDRFFKHEAAGGVILMSAAILALVFSNTSLAAIYDQLISAKLAVTLDGAGLEKPLILWINDGLMAIFFFLIGMELKREVLEGKLRDPRQIILPGLAAVGGMAFPALVYAVLNWDDAELIRGWAIPAATDIAFALGVLALVGVRAPAALKMFLLTLAILDDLGAIIIIALFYTENLSITMLAFALLPLMGLLALNWKRSHHGPIYLLLGLVLWVCVLKSGVHATLAGVIVALTIPLKCKNGADLLHRYEHGLTPYVLYGVLPIFAFANAGVALVGMSFMDLFDPLPLGIALGLLIGKQIGVFGCTWLAVRSGLAQLPEGVTWLHVYGVSCLAGIGFTMSLFIGGLSFDAEANAAGVRIGVLAGSILSGIIGYVVLRYFAGKQPIGAEFQPAQ
ncbi:MAG: Na+/H+ antiporter NhaA [Rhodobacteraceae bacterium]|nr:Na+/H+ antiporter NhaA [Paracoccaceae bacterium]